MATRISLLHSARQREERQQIGNMTTPFANSLKELEKRCLIRLSQAARGANQVQIALNSIMRAHKLYLHRRFRKSLPMSYGSKENKQSPFSIFKR